MACPFGVDVERSRAEEDDNLLDLRYAGRQMLCLCVEGCPMLKSRTHVPMFLALARLSHEGEVRMGVIRTSKPQVGLSLPASGAVEVLLL